MSNIYIKTVKTVNHTAFCVGKNGQKSFYEPSFKKYCAYSSGQQVKYSIREKLNEILGVPGAPVKFIWNIDKDGKMTEGEAHTLCNPKYVDVLFGGWMRTKDKLNKEEDAYNKTLKRRSPLSISPMTPLHPLLATLNEEEISFSRTGVNSTAAVRDESGNFLSEEEMIAALDKNGRELNLRKKWLGEKSSDFKRVTGVFEHDMVIDLKRLFTVSLNPFEPEISPETAKELLEEGWKTIEILGEKHLLAPLKFRENAAKALVDAIIDWKITSNQSTSYSPMETIAISVSSDAHSCQYGVMGVLNEDEKSAKVIINKVEGVKNFITPAAAKYAYVEKMDLWAITNAKTELYNQIIAFKY